jgi:hypothetical protein
VKQQEREMEEEEEEEEEDLRTHTSRRQREDHQSLYYNIRMIRAQQGPKSEGDSRCAQHLLQMDGTDVEPREYPRPGFRVNKQPNQNREEAMHEGYTPTRPQAKAANWWQICEHTYDVWKDPNAPLFPVDTFPTLNSSSRVEVHTKSTLVSWWSSLYHVIL